MKYYIATKLENHEAHNRVRDMLNAMGHRITYDWTTHGPMYPHGLEAIQRVSEAEARGVMDAHFVVMLWPGGRGTHVELGIAIGRGIPVILVTPVDAHFEATPETCAFYHHPLVFMCRNESQIPGTLYDIEDYFGSQGLNSAAGLVDVEVPGPRFSKAEGGDWVPCPTSEVVIPEGPRVNVLDELRKESETASEVCHIPMCRGLDGRTIPHTMDAMAWARDFRSMVDRVPGGHKELGVLVGWFANAIMAGYDEAMRRSGKK